MRIDIATPRWALPLLEPARYKGAHGGRASGKSHFFAELAVDRMVEDPDLSVACIREIQRSLKYSAKRVIEAKIRALGVSHLFRVTNTEIHRRNGSGLMIFQGMQDHTAETVQSLEGFGVAWVEEAQRLSERSLRILRPTIRSKGSELWFSWNPQHPEDPVDDMLCGDPPDNARVVSCTFLDNPFVPDEAIEEAREDYRKKPDLYPHIWLGEYHTVNEAQILAGKWRVEAFEASDAWDGPYHGMDYGFSTDPTAAVRAWIAGNRLMVEHEAHGHHWEIDSIAWRVNGAIPGAAKHEIRADSNRPETTRHLQKKGLPYAVSVHKWPGSVEDGIEYLRSFDEIVVHPRCVETIRECRLYSYKIDRKSGEIRREPKDAYNHCIDAIRYALAPMIRQSGDVLIGRA